MKYIFPLFVLLNLILPPDMWGKVAWMILRDPPNCGAKLITSASGNGNSYYYLTLEGSQESIDCAERTIDREKKWF